MVVQNNDFPRVLLALVILGGAVALGLLLTDTEFFNYHKSIVGANATATHSALKAREFSGILQATETPRALQVAAVAQATAIPVQQTVTHATLQVAQANATQTALAVKARNEELQAQATQTRIAQVQTVVAGQEQATQTRVAQEQAANALSARATATSIAGAIISDANKRDNENTRAMAFTIAMVVALIAIVVCITALVIASANIKAANAAAQLEREKRRTLEVQAALRAPPTNIIPLSTARGPKNGHGEQEKIAA
ncbi:MAG: hypothetical protein N2559_10860 [Anaerolineae bacterium]|nr:hypothetical protein [Anaerolineae bacterium]